jgi:hypothetical protein
MKINLLSKKFDDNRILYAPELKLPEAKNVAEKCFPAVRVHPNFIDQAEYFLLLDSEIGEYEERIRHPEKGLLFRELCGRINIERQFNAIFNRQNEEGRG